MSSPLTPVQRRNAKIVGAVLAVTSIISILVMWFHPSVSSVDINHQIQESSEEASVNKFVHSTLIAFIVLISCCLTFYAKQRGMHRSFVLFGTIVYWLSTTLMILAALLSGIVGPELAANYMQANQSEAEVYKGLSLLKFEMNQAFANFAVHCWSVTIALWSMDMMTKSGLMRQFGLISLIAGVGISISLLMGWVSLSVFGMTLILVIVSVWQIGIACLLAFIPDLVAD